MLFFSCKKDGNDTPNNSRMVKYEITGNFSGKLTIIYNDNVNGNTVLTDISLPWSKDITYGNNITGIGIGASSSTFGTSGQTATMKIYSGGSVVKTSTGTANSSGGITIPTVAHVF
jgi:hypothetical protein